MNCTICDIGIDKANAKELLSGGFACDMCELKELVYYFDFVGEYNETIR